MADEKKRNPVTISWSSLRAHEECRHKAMLLRSGKKNPAQNIRAYFHGTVVDRVMRYWLDLDSPQKGEMAQMVRDVVDQEELEAINSGDGVVRWRNGTDKEDMIAWCQELVTKLEDSLYRLVIPYEYEVAKRYRVPVRISWLDGSPTWINLAGEIDLLVRGNDGLFRIWDLKGTADNSYWRKTLGQLIFYDLSVKAMFGSNAVKCGLIQPMCREQVLEFSFTDQDRREMWSRVMRMASDIWTKDFEPKEESSGCSFCAVRHACSRFTINPAAKSNRLSLQGMANIGQEFSLLDLLEEGK